MEVTVSEEEYLLLIGELYVEKRKITQLLAQILKQKDEVSEIATDLQKKNRRLLDQIEKKERETQGDRGKGHPIVTIAEGSPSANGQGDGTGESD